MRRTFVKTLLGAAVVAAFGSVAHAQQGKPVKIGLLATLEGPFAAGGQDGMRGAELAIRESEKGLSTGEKQMYTRAKRILASELMYALEREEDDADEHLEELIADAHATRLGSSPTT